MNETQPVQPTPSLPTPIPSEPAAKKWYKNKKAKVAIILFVLIATALAICAYFAFTKSNQPVVTNPAPVVQAPAQEWTTYKDDKFGFSIDYPKDWGFVANALSSGGNGGANYVFCPPENIDSNDSGTTCKVRDDNPSVPDYQSPIIYLSSWSKSEFKGDLTKEGIWLSTDGNYVYELRASGADAYGDIYKQMIATFKFKEKPKAGEVSWNEAKKLEDLKIFVPFVTDPPYSDLGMGYTAFDATYHLVGHVNSGKYANAEVITAQRGNGDYYTILRKNDKITVLSKYSIPEVDAVDSGDFATAPDIDADYAIAELDYPDKIDSPTPGVSYNSPTASMSFDPNYAKPSTDKKIATDTKWGSIYDNEEPTMISIILPNGLQIKYTIAETDLPTVALGSRHLSDYMMTAGYYCSKDWNQQDHGAYYEDKSLQKIGDINGLPVYEMKDATLLKNLYTDISGQNADIPSMEYPGMKNVTLKAFTASHPMLVWTDPFGRKVPLMDKTYCACTTEMGKPVIYLYPRQEEKVSVKVQTPGPMTVSIPDYNGGWNVSAKPDGTLTELITGKKYPYLFWESEGGSGYSMPKEGFNVAAKDLHTFFETTLAKYGLSDKERADFEEFWVPRLESKNSPYYFITFTTTEGMQKYAPLTISPEPDTLIRVFMDYQLIKSPISAKEPRVTTPVRKGFTVIEWGGALK